MRSRLRSRLPAGSAERAALLERAQHEIAQHVALGHDLRLAQDLGVAAVCLPDGRSLTLAEYDELRGAAAIAAERRQAYEAAIPGVRRARLAALSPRIDRDGWRVVERGDLRLTDAFRELRRWARDRDGRPFLGLFGPPGVGKSVAAVEWLVGEDLGPRPDERLPHFGQPLSTEPRGELVVWDDLVRLSSARSSWREERPDFERFEGLMSAPRLVVDEVPIEEPIAPLAARRVMFALFNRRMTPGHRTALIANMTLATFVRCYAGRGVALEHEDARLTDRIRSQLEAAHLTGRSLRRGELPS